MVLENMSRSQKYPQDLSLNRLLCEVSFLKSEVSTFIPGDKQLQNCTALDVLKILSENNLRSQFENCHTALRIFLMFPVSVASNERPFSKLKLIKNYLRSTMSQDRLSNLSILSIESERAEKLSFKEIISEFARNKCRRIKLSTSEMQETGGDTFN